MHSAKEKTFLALLLLQKWCVRKCNTKTHASFRNHSKIKSKTYQNYWINIEVWLVKLVQTIKLKIAKKRKAKKIRTNDKTKNRKKERSVFVCIVFWLSMQDSDDRRIEIAKWMSFNLYFYLAIYSIYLTNPNYSSLLATVLVWFFSFTFSSEIEKKEID